MLSIPGIRPCGQNFQPFLPPSCKFCCIFIFHHKWDTFISPLTNHAVKEELENQSSCFSKCLDAARERNENQLIVMNSRYSRDVPYRPPPAVSPYKPTHLQLSTLRCNHKPLGSKRKNTPFCSRAVSVCLSSSLICFPWEQVVSYFPSLHG